MSRSDETRHRHYLWEGGAVAFAHRGGAIEAPENTLAAFRAAADLGYQYFETDVHLSADGVVVAFHDASIDRTTGGSGAIADMDWDEICSHLVEDREPIPSMRELFLAFPDAFFNIDVKSDAVVEPLIELIEELAVHDHVCIGSFGASRLKKVRSLTANAVCTSASPIEVIQTLIKAHTGIGDIARGPDAYQIPRSMLGIPVATQRFVSLCHLNGLHVHVWTIDDPSVVHDLLEIGVDGIMTDRPTEIKEVFVERGLWPNRPIQS